MLVLTRKADEQILIGDDIKITLVRIRGGSVRIGIEAPREIRVVRGELEKHEATETKSASRQASKSSSLTVSDNAVVDKQDDDCREAPIDAMAEVFAHPESEIKARAKHQARRRPNRLLKDNCGETPRVPTNEFTASPHSDESAVFVGRVSRDGEVELQRAPLSSFMAAS